VLCPAQGDGGVTDRTHDIGESARLARRAAELGRDDAIALCTAGFALADVAADFEAGDALIERALRLNSNSAWAWLFSAWVKVWLGEREVAIERAARAMRLSPHDPHLFMMQHAIAMAHYFTLPAAMPKRCHGRKRRCARNQIVSLEYVLLQQARRLQNNSPRREKRWRVCENLSPRCGSPI
jgi:hypothetical protein